MAAQTGPYQKPEPSGSGSIAVALSLPARIGVHPEPVQPKFRCPEFALLGRDRRFEFIQTTSSGQGIRVSMLERRTGLA
jgi:hypothetical protein